jgi:hypothetical protein
MGLLHDLNPCYLVIDNVYRRLLSDEAKTLNINAARSTKYY